MNKMPTIQIQGGHHSSVNPYIIAFVYPRVGEAVVLHGFMYAVIENILHQYPVSLVHFLVNKKSRQYKWVEVFGISRQYRCIAINNLLEPCGMERACKKRRRCVFKIVDRSLTGGKRGQVIKIIRVRRFPRSWMDELDPYIDIEEVDLPMNRVQPVSASIQEEFDDWVVKVIEQSPVVEQSPVEDLISNFEQYPVEDLISNFNKFPIEDLTSNFNINISKDNISYYIKNKENKIHVK